MRHWSVCCLIIIFFLQGCGKKQLSLYDRIAHKKVPVLCQFEVEIEGVECALCAQDAKSIFEDLEGASAADFVMTGTSYEQGYIHFCYDIRKNNFDLQKIDQAVTSEGFVLHSLKGVFNLSVMQKENRYFVIYNDGYELPLLMPQTAEDAAKIINLSMKEAQFIHGKMLRQLDNTFIFIPEYPITKR